MDRRYLKLDTWKIWQLMHKKHMTETSIAAEMGCSVVNVCKILNPYKRTHLKSAQSLAKVLGVPVRFIIMEE